MYQESLGGEPTCILAASRVAGRVAAKEMKELDQIPIFSSSTHFRPDTAAGPPLLEKYNTAPSRSSPPPVTYVREHTYRVTSA
ncbi:unnamed protein product [Gongylonema pulchrum]|uniref:UmuC domain-containing protein n=1 Tax=Gongylonema pulchrum TaxID=637853 RepID=A0A183CUZ0_9BILA|nr:unnamed protein product [Gongylonema pulchrum]